ncbi:class I SAM-dependent methyltransferase [Streptomyces anulatus]|uniref:Class I SAM-dependent methyltransferase n=3 Tax=Streptomyces TaxID=1883 RepID=A0A7K3REA4_STRAQ|nr:class I SAM-dependent methyltransferase [Streptomyces anulatus]NEC00327.1 class I SAM-dependent methyltransferase [Streptomyces anulatus]NED27394.1 class I SAM-dependent methyltransferase [Streptomyces anulatus]
MPALDARTSEAAADAAELERVLGTHPDVERCTVLTGTRPDGVPVSTAYVLPRRNEVVQHDGAVLGRQYVAEWQGVYDHVYAQQTSSDPTFDTRGWLSSYTGGELGEDDMRAWLDDTVTRIKSLGARRILEVGCGTGMLLHRLAPGADRYLGSDISAGAIDRIREAFDGRLPDGVEVFQAPADDLSAVAPRSVDGFVVNSVSQYFPDEEYLDRVVSQAVDAVDEGGFLFIGDVRSAALNRAFSAGLELARAPERAPSEKVQALVERRCCTGTELMIDPCYFTALVGRLPRVAHVAVLLRRGKRRTEMNRFRYDVVIRLDRLPAGEVDVPDWRPWERDRWGAAELRRHLQEERPPVLGLLGVPNARVLADHAAAELLARPDRPAVAGEVLAQATAEAGEGVDPEEIWSLGDDLPYAVRLSWARSLPDGAFDVSLVRVDGSARAPEVRFPEAPAPPRMPVNRPWYGRVENVNPVKLRAHVRAQGAESVMPGRFVLLESMPDTDGDSSGGESLRSIQWA